MKVFTIRYKNPAFPFLLTCSLLFPLLAMLVGWLTYCTSSSSKTEKLSVTDGDGNWKGKTSSHYFSHLPLLEASIFSPYQEAGLFLAPLFPRALPVLSSFPSYQGSHSDFLLGALHPTPYSLSSSPFFNFFSLKCIALCPSMSRPYLITFFFCWLDFKKWKGNKMEEINATELQGWNTRWG